MLSLLLSILLVLIVIGALLAWPYGPDWRYDPSGAARLVPLICHQPVGGPGVTVSNAGTSDGGSVRSSECASD